MTVVALVKYKEPCIPTLSLMGGETFLGISLKSRNRTCCLAKARNTWLKKENYSILIIQLKVVFTGKKLKNTLVPIRN